MGLARPLAGDVGEYEGEPDFWIDVVRFWTLLTNQHGPQSRKKLIGSPNDNKNFGLMRAQVLAFFAGLSPCLVGMEACGTSHHWARELAKLGHEVRPMPPAYVKPLIGTLKLHQHRTSDPPDPFPGLVRHGRDAPI